MERSDRIPLAADVSRCDPANPGRAAARCARRMASVLQGSPMTDFSQMPGGGCTVLCSGYMDVGALAQQQRLAQSIPAPRATKPWPGTTR